MQTKTSSVFKLLNLINSKYQISALLSFELSFVAFGAVLAGLTRDRLPFAFALRALHRVLLLWHSLLSKDTLCALIWFFAAMFEGNLFLLFVDKKEPKTPLIITRNSGCCYNVTMHLSMILALSHQSTMCGC